MQKKNILQSCTATAETDSISTQLQLLTEKVNALTLTNTEKDTNKRTH